MVNALCQWIGILVAVYILYTIIMPQFAKKIQDKLYSDQKIEQLVKKLTAVDPAISKIPIYSGKKSYTINKHTIYLCLRDENNKYYNDNMLTYVLLHEVAHFLNRENEGHTEEFNSVFNTLLDKAELMGLYNPAIPPILDYCMYS